MFEENGQGEKALITALLMITAISVVGMIYLGAQVKTVPIIIEVDDKQNPRVITRSISGEDAKPLLIKRELMEFVERSFRVLPDPDVLVRDSEWVASHLDPTDGLFDKYKKIYEDPATSPVELAKRVIRTVKVDTPLQIANRTWDIKFSITEKSRGNGDILDVIKYRGVLTIAPGTPDIERYDSGANNPIGLIVQSFDWAKEE